VCQGSSIGPASCAAAGAYCCCFVSSTGRSCLLRGLIVRLLAALVRTRGTAAADFMPAGSSDGMTRKSSGSSHMPSPSNSTLHMLPLTATRITVPLEELEAAAVLLLLPLLLLLLPLLLLVGLVVPCGVLFALGGRGDLRTLGVGSGVGSALLLLLPSRELVWLIFSAALMLWIGLLHMPVMLLLYLSALLYTLALLLLVVLVLLQRRLLLLPLLLLLVGRVLPLLLLALLRYVLPRPSAAADMPSWPAVVGVRGGAATRMGVICRGRISSLGTFCSAALLLLLLLLSTGAVLAVAAGLKALLLLLLLLLLYSADLIPLLLRVAVAAVAGSGCRDSALRCTATDAVPSPPAAFAGPVTAADDEWVPQPCKPAPMCRLCATLAAFCLRLEKRSGGCCSGCCWCCCV